MYMILFVLHNQDLLRDVMEAWEKEGVNGITILLSTGLQRLRASDVLREDLPLIPSLEDLIRQEETTNRTLFTIVKDDEMVDRVVGCHPIDHRGSEPAQHGHSHGVASGACLWSGSKNTVQRRT